MADETYRRYNAGKYEPTGKEIERASGKPKIEEAYKSYARQRTGAGKEPVSRPTYSKTWLQQNPEDRDKK